MLIDEVQESMQEEINLFNSWGDILKPVDGFQELTALKYVFLQLRIKVNK